LEQVEALPEVDQFIGCDLGLKQFLIPSSGKPVENPRYFRQTEKQLARAQHQLSRMKKGSKNYLKQKVKVAKLHEKISNQRKDFLQQESTRLIRENQIICLRRPASAEHDQKPQAGEVDPGRRMGRV